jgi:predicted lipoprotein with Yx(FWY)xxD motif
MQLYAFSRRYDGSFSPISYNVRELTAAAHTFIVRKDGNNKWVAYRGKELATRPQSTRSYACLLMSTMLDKENAR